MCNKVILAT